MAHCTNSFGQGWQHATSILFSPLRVGFWLLMAILAFTSELPNMIPFPSLSQEQLEDFQRDPSIIEPYIMTILIFATVYFFVMLIFTLISTAVRILFFVGVRNGTVPIIKTLGEQASRIITLFIWNVIVPLIGLIILGITGFVLTLAILLPMGAVDVASLGIAAILILGSFGIFSIFFVVLYMILMNAFVIPQMIFQEKGIFQAWGNTIGIMFGELFEFVGFCLIRFAILTVIFVCIFIPAVVVTLLFASVEEALAENLITQMLVMSALKVPFIFMVEFVLLPVSIFLDSYSLSFLRGITGDKRFLLVSDTGVSSNQATSSQSQTSSSIPPAPTQDTPATSVNNDEPVSFKDIPVETNTKLEVPPLNPHSTEPQTTTEDDKKEPPLSPPPKV